MTNVKGITELTRRVLLVAKAGAKYIAVAGLSERLALPSYSRAALTHTGPFTTATADPVFYRAAPYEFSV
ncbi:hypothetical protein [Sphingomonas sp. ASV193]|uniref:hypothetical protein n=1 Tax=Sphingomonas sp. ASV193 TaxID=3144405 RepID=UPI0032E85EEB